MLRERKALPKKRSVSLSLSLSHRSLYFVSKREWNGMADSEKISTGRTRNNWPDGIPKYKKRSSPASVDPPSQKATASKQALAQRGHDPEPRRAGCEYEARCAAHGRIFFSFFFSLVGTAHGEGLAGAAGGGEIGGESLGRWMRGVESLMEVDGCVRDAAAVVT